MAEHHPVSSSSEEFLDVLTSSGQHTGISKPRSHVHRDGDYHRAVEVWIYVESTGELVVQKRADGKDSWPGRWDTSSAGHITAGDTSLLSAMRELEEELGIRLPPEAFELIYVYRQEWITNNGTFINNEFNDVYLVTILEPIPLDGFSLQESEVSMVKYIGCDEYENRLREKDPEYVPHDIDGDYSKLFSRIRDRYHLDPLQRQLTLERKLGCYASVNLAAELSTLSNGDLRALSLTVQAAQILDKLFLEQVWPTNPLLKSWLEGRQAESELARLQYAYYSINKSPWSCLGNNTAFLSTADSAVCEASNALTALPGWKGLQYRAAFPLLKPAGANFYPADMDQAEFKIWCERNAENQDAAKGFFTVIRRHEHFTRNGINTLSDPTNSIGGLHVIPYSEEYKAHLTEAAKLLHVAGHAADTPSLKRLLEAKADAFLSNDYYDSDVAWIQLDSPIDVTIGPYETYEDGLFGYKATFEAYIGLRDDVATSQVNLFSNYLQELEDNLPFDAKYKSKDVKASPIRVMQLLFNAGDVKGPQTLAFNLPNDERVIKKHGNAMVMMKNISQAKFDTILLPIAAVCLSESQKKDVDFDSYFTHIICHECCHGIGPHSITLPDGKKTTVRRELQELNSSIEEAKADIVGLWALRYLLDKNLLPKKLEECMYVSFLAGCFRSIRFGLHEAHGRGQALQFNWILEKEGFVMHPDGRFSVDFSKIKQAVESLCNEILTIQAEGDKEAARKILDAYAVITPPLEQVLSLLENVAVPVDIAPTFDVINHLKIRSFW